MVEAARAEFASRKEAERIDFRVGDALEILDSLVAELSDADESEKYDFVFIDAAKSHYREFFEAAEKICTKDALIVCDNILLKGWIVQAEGSAAKRHRTSIKYIKKFLEYLRMRDDLEVSVLTGADGLAIIRFLDENNR
jgi:predicted O-methyltransferase YrrM